MSTNYPSGADSFTNPAGTSLETNPDHAGQHTNINDSMVAVQTTLGTTAGTSVLKNFSAGQFPQRVTGGGATGTLVATSVGGTFSNSVINNGTIGTPVLTGGTITGTPVLDINSIPGSSLSTNALFLGYSAFTGTQVIPGASPTAITNGTVTVTVPSGGRQVKITAYTGDWQNNVGTYAHTLQIKEGSGTLNSANFIGILSGQTISSTTFYIGTTSTGAHTYTALAATSVGTLTIANRTGFTGFLLVELI